MAQAAGNVPICFDVNHLLGESDEDFMKALATNVVTTDLSDYDGVDERHWLPGMGIVPWKDVVKTLMENGYRGPFLFELRAGENGPYAAKEVLDAFVKALSRVMIGAQLKTLRAVIKGELPCRRNRASVPVPYLIRSARTPCGCYGQEPPITPNLDALAEEGTRF